MNPEDLERLVYQLWKDSAELMRVDTSKLRLGDIRDIQQVRDNINKVLEGVK
jgi:hypothetical protein